MHEQTLNYMQYYQELGTDCLITVEVCTKGNHDASRSFHLKHTQYMDWFPCRKLAQAATGPQHSTVLHLGSPAELNQSMWAQFCVATGFFRSVVTKKRRESAHARNSPFKIPSKMRACADSRRLFVTTDLKNPVLL